MANQGEEAPRIHQTNSGLWRAFYVRPDDPTRKRVFTAATRAEVELHLRGVFAPEQE